jgi:hypothetical protein
MEPINEPALWATIITLRTNGERGDQCSFMGLLRPPDAGAPVTRERRSSPKYNLQ